MDKYGIEMMLLSSTRPAVQAILDREESQLRWRAAPTIILGREEVG